MSIVQFILGFVIGSAIYDSIKILCYTLYAKWMTRQLLKKITYEIEQRIKNQENVEYINGEDSLGDNDNVH